MIRKSLISGLFGGLIVAVVMVMFAPSGGEGVVQNEPAFERVVDSGVLRCGYNFWDPALVFDENKQKLKGFYHDVMTAFEKESGLQVKWEKVVDWGNVTAELTAGRIDAMCAMWNTSLESRYILFSKPFAFQSVEVIARADDARFDQNIEDINDETVKIAVIDNATQDFIARTDFPEAERVSLTMLSSNAELMMDVANKKSDITFTNPGIFYGFNASNPAVLKRVKPGHNIRLYGTSLAFDVKEHSLANLVNTSFQHLINTGVIDQLIRKYNSTHPDTFIKPTKTFAGEQ